MDPPGQILEEPGTRKFFVVLLPGHCNDQPTGLAADAVGYLNGHQTRSRHRNVTPRDCRHREYGKIFSSGKAPFPLEHFVLVVKVGRVRKVGIIGMVGYVATLGA